MNENVFSLLVCGWGMLPLRQSRKKKREKNRQAKVARSVCVPRAIPGLAYAKQSIIIYMYIYKFIAFFF